MNEDSKNSIKTKLIIGAVSALMVVVATLMCSCGVVQTDDGALNVETYMTELNSVANSVDSTLKEFDEAAKKSDIDAMERHASTLNGVISMFKTLQPCNECKEVHELYLDGMTNLQTALNQYCSLTKDVKNAKEGKNKQDSQNSDENNSSENNENNSNNNSDNAQANNSDNNNQSQNVDVNQRMKDIQSLYNTGVEKLKEADKKALEVSKQQ